MKVWCKNSVIPRFLTWEISEPCVVQHFPGWPKVVADLIAHPTLMTFPLVCHFSNLTCVSLHLQINPFQILVSGSAF